MNIMNTNLPLIVLVGPTASGKTALAIKIAKKCNGEIICADSKTIYRDMDIGTAKPTTIEQQAVPHWGINLVNPGEYFTAADFKTYADSKISEIRGRGHTPFLVGGTGLYIDSVLFNFSFGPKISYPQRYKLQHKTLDELIDYCNNNNIELPENDKNKRYLVRAIEMAGHDRTQDEQPMVGSIVVGITTDKTKLQKRILDRSEKMFNNGVVEEARELGRLYGWDNEAMKANIYPLVREYLEGNKSLDDVKNTSAHLDWKLAKRQLTWFKRNKFIQWMSLNDAKLYLEEKLAINR